MSDTENPRRTVWTCKVGDRVVRLEDIPARQLAELEKKFQTSWLRLVSQPFGDLATPNVEQALAMYERCCELVGAEPRELTAGQLSAMFDLVDDDRPDLYVGGLPDPKAGELTTAG